MGFNEGPFLQELLEMILQPLDWKELLCISKTFG